MKNTQSKETEKKKTGRPKIEIDEKLLFDLAKIHCTNEEMAAIMGCSKDTLETRFSAIIKKARQEGRASLRRRQFLAAQSGNVTMLIWLGKQLLGQREPQKMEEIDEQNKSQAVQLFALMKHYEDQIKKGEKDEREN